MARISLKHRAEYCLLRCAAALVRLLPRPPALALGRAAGRLAPWVLPERYRLAKNNIQQALPHLGAAQVADLARRNFEQLGISAVESLRLDRFRSDRVEEFFELEGIEHLHEARKLDRGVLLLTAHLGFWEAGTFLLPALGIPFDSIAKPLKNPLIDAYFQRTRCHFGAAVLNSRKGARRILKSLQAGRVVGLLLDQHISPPGSVAIDFFGRKAYTTTAVTSMAMKHRIPVVPAFCLRQPDNRYRVRVEPMLLLTGDGEEAVLENTQYLTSIIEAAVRRDPSQWFWMHRRWRNKKAKGRTIRKTSQ